MSRSWKGGSTTAWRKLRARVLARDKYQCQIRLPGEWTTWRGHKRRCQIKADCVHHTQGKAITGDDPRYLQAACTPCNLKVGDAIQHNPRPRPRTQW